MSFELDFKKLEKTLNNAANKLKSDFDCNLSVDRKLIFNDLTIFNNKFHANFTDNTSNDEIKSFFINSYIKLFKKYSNNAKSEFNSLYSPYAEVN